MDPRQAPAMPTPSTPSDVATAPAEGRPWMKGEHLFLLLMWVYLSRVLVGRWLYHYLFFKLTARDLAMAAGFELSYMVFSSALAVAGWIAILYLVLQLVPGISRRLLVPLAILFVAVVAVLEVDMAWFGMSHRHVAWQMVPSGLKEVGGGQWGVTRADLVRHGVYVLKQALLIGAGAVLCRYAERLRWRIRWRLRPGALALAVLGLLAVDSAAVGHRLAGGYKQWELLTAANPFRFTFADRMWERYFQSRQASHLDVVEANRLLARLDARPPVLREPRLASPGAASRGRPDVLLVVAESLNAFQVDAGSMPALFRLAGSSFVFGDHYSTGNFSEAGQLSLLYGTAPTFYLGNDPSHAPGSRYVDLFNARGYRTGLIGHNFRNWRNIDTYLRNLNHPIVELEHDWDLVEAVHAELRTPGPHFLAVFYYGTHFPYDHDGRFRAFQPETPPGFDYFSARLRDHRAEVVNRYRNALLELDAWIDALLKGIDLDHTVVAITGDHGEELFENGILGHASDLDAPQIRTPLVIRVPGRGHRQIDQVTSHADVLPTVVDLLGWERPPGMAGGSLLASSPAARAFVADTDYPSPPRRWAVITPGRKSIVEHDPGRSLLRIASLRDEADRPVAFKDDPSAWEENFREIRALEEAIAAEAGRPLVGAAAVGGR